MRDTTARVPVRDGAMLADILQEWAVRRVQAELPGYFSNARVVVVGNATRERTLTVLREFTANIDIEDPDKRVGTPLAVGLNPVTSRVAAAGMVAWDLAPDVVKKAAHGPAAWVSGQFAHQAAEFADVIVGSYADLVRFLGRPTSPARPSSPTPSPRSGSPPSRPRASPSSSTRRPSPSTSWSSPRCSRRWRRLRSPTATS